MNYIDYSKINELHIELSSLCKLKCLHCSSSKILAENKGGYETESLVPFFKRFKANSCHVYITGGEPLLSPRLFPLIKLCKDIGFKVGLFTTFNTGEKAEYVIEKLAKVQLDDFYVSLYDDNAQGHDFVTGTTGSFDNSIGAIQTAKKFGIQPKINFVLLKTNLERIGNILNSLDALGAAEIRLLKLVKHGNAVNNWQTVGIDENAQIQAVKPFIGSNNFKTELTFSGFPQLTNCRPFTSEFKCGACNTLLYVDNYGDVYPCASQKNDINKKLGTVFNPQTIINKAYCCVKW